MQDAYLSREQREKLLLEAGWEPWPCWIDPLKKTLVCEEVAMREQQGRDGGKAVVIPWASHDSTKR